MTRYRIISDLHTEIWPEARNKAIRMVDQRLPSFQEDQDSVLLLAGDTGSHKRWNIYAAVIEHLCSRFKKVIDIPGNHFWYGGADWNDVTPPTSLPNYVFGATFVEGEVVAATLWADFQRGNPIVELACIDGMNDFKQIPGLTPDLVKERHAEHVRFLSENMKPGCVVMTHFAPSWQSIPEGFATDIRNGYYATDLEELILEKEPALFVHGHIHTAKDYMIGRTRVICNPAGYEGKDHNSMLVVDVPDV